MNLLLGDRATANLIREGAKRADIEALFDISLDEKAKDFLESNDFEHASDEIVLRRVISSGGKSKCFLNGSIVTRSMLAKVGALLVDMHGQHEHQSLMQPAKHLALLDDFGGLIADVALVRQSYQELKQNVSELERIIARESSRNERVTDLERELALLDKADIKEGEEEQIRLRRNLIANSEKIHRLASEAYDMLFGGETYRPPLMDTWDRIMQNLREIAQIDESLQKPLEEYEEVQFKFDEFAPMLQSYISDLEYDAAELETLEDRLETISKLKRRHGCNSLEELLEKRKQLQEEYNRITGSSAERAMIEGEVDRMRLQLSKDAFVLSQKRSEAAERLGRNIQLQLRDLGMKKAKFEVSIRQEQAPEGLVQHKRKNWKIWNTGVDKIEFLFSANVGEPLKPLRAIASGGEISRIMLAIRTVLAKTDQVPVVIFDEIDSGVGASMGMMIAQKLVSVANSRQVICVTHLPQIAAMAENHVVVDKQVEGGRTRTEVEYPKGDNRVQEIARMLGGKATGKISLKHAQELLALAQKNR
jgi:DNA repair protein RecN (Recombination protein N)